MPQIHRRRSVQQRRSAGITYGNNLPALRPRRGLMAMGGRRVSRRKLLAGTAAVVVVLLGGTAFDSFGATTGWIRMVQTSDLPSELWGTLGLLGMIALVAATFALGVRGLAADVMAASVVPIVVGYTLGHYLSLLVLEGQRTAGLLSDPLGLGWNLFGTAEAGIAQLWLENPTATALIQLFAIVGGHLLGVLVAHDLAIARLPATRAVSGQVPLLLVMVGYTVGGLTLLFSP